MTVPVAGDRRAAETADAEVRREAAEYAARIRRTNLRLAFGVAILLAVVGALPITAEAHRTGVIVSAVGLLLLALLWFGLVPATAFGDRRVMVFALLALPVGATLVALTGAGDSPYVPFMLLLVIVTVYTPRAADTVIVACATAVALLAAIAIGRPADPSQDRLPVVATHLLQLATYAFVAAAVGRALRDARSAITARAEALAGERSDAMRLAFTDVLTGLYNRRYAEDLLPRLVADAKRGRLFSVLALDLDGLKRINDTYGHDAGDRAIARIGEVLRLSLRGADVAVRLGGDEFLALLPGTRADQARTVGDRIRATMAAADWSDVGAPITITYGAAQWQEGDSGADVLKAADGRLYESKRSRAPNAQTL